MIFDSHAHLVSSDQDRYPPSPISGRLAPGEYDLPMTADRLLQCMKEEGVERALVVQRAHVYGFDNAYVLDSAAANPDRLSAMCMVDATSPGAPAAVRGWLRRGVMGIRLTEPFKGADASWFASPEALQVWAAACDEGASIRLHFYRWNRALCLPALNAVLERFPQSTVVLDHLSNISAEEGSPEYGIDAPLLKIARFPGVHLLFSTINLAKLKAAQVPSSPVIKRAVQAFGPDRVLWGSDAGQSRESYRELVEMAHAAVADLSESERHSVLYANGTRLYGPRSRA